MKNTTRNKLVGTFLIVALVTIAGAVLVSAETDEAGDVIEEQEWCRPMMQERMPFFSELTEEQQQEIEELRTELSESGATPEEVHEAVTEKLREFGIDIPTRAEQLAQEIERTEQQLEILNRKKELLESGYSWKEIQDTIQEEFDLEASMGPGQGMGPHRGGPRGCGRGMHGGFPMQEDSEVAS